MKIIQISDTHITHLGGTTNENAERAIRFINSLQADLVVHTGDITIMDPDRDADREVAVRILAGVEAPLKVIPGNHDVGEPGDNPFGDRPVTSERVAAYRAHFGDDRFVELVGDWAVVGIDSELFESGLSEEAEQWEWLERLPEVVGERPTLVFTHKPIRAPRAEQQDTHLSIGSVAAPRLEESLAKIDVRGYGSGHLHHYALTWLDGRPVVSAPSTAFNVASETSAELMGPGLSQLGIVEWTLAERTAKPYFRAPLDLEDAFLLEIDAVRAALDEMGISLTGLSA